MKMILLSVGASHYRKQIYSMIDKQLGCSFVFGSGQTSVKSFDISVLNNAVEVPIVPIGRGRIYKIPKALDNIWLNDVIIDDMGICCATSWRLLFESRWHHKKVYVWSHGWYGREGFIKKWLKRLYFGLADGSFIYGNYARDLMIMNGFDSKKLYVIHNSLNYDAQLNIRKSLLPSSIYFDHFKNNYPVLLMIGRLNFRKNLHLLIEAVADLKEKEKFFNIVLIGMGEDRDRLEILSRERSIKDQVWFYGECYEEEKNAVLIYNADICVVPGDIGLTAMHAMMFGTPCISHDYLPNQGPEFEAIREGVTGCFFKHNDVEDLANSIASWFESHKNDREAVRQACYKEIDENWNPHKQIEIIKNVIYGK